MEVSARAVSSSFRLMTMGNDATLLSAIKDGIIAAKSKHRARKRSHVANRRATWMMVALIGATSGFLVALLFEMTGHPWWTILLLLFCLLGPTLLIPLASTQVPEVIGRLRRQPSWMRIGLALALVLLSFQALETLGINPRAQAYVPLIVPVVVSAVLLSFGPGLFAVIFATLWADYFYALPEYDFAITEWEDAAGLAIFAILGAFIALIIGLLIPVSDWLPSGEQVSAIERNGRDPRSSEGE